jgi:glycosyltransferase involved in cell wall biosynthesis
VIKLSVVIITFNEEKNIERCINSVKSVADEIIVLDSFSSDKTKEICDSAIQNDIKAFPYLPIKIQTIHKKQISCKKINFDESGSIELSNITNNLFLVDITKNMKIISQDLIEKFSL